MPTSIPMADALRKDIPEISYVAQTDWMFPHALLAGHTKLYLGGAIASSDFLKIFPYEFSSGNAAGALKDPYSIVLTQSTATALFGHEDPVGKTVRLDNEHDLKVTGILKDLPANATLQFNYLIPFSYSLATTTRLSARTQDWGNNSFQTFVALKPHVTYAQVEPKIKMILQKYAPAIYRPSKGELFMQPETDWHLYSDFKDGLPSGGLIDYIRIFSMIGLLVLLIACINFMNLSTARSEKRAREVGIRKAIGSQRKDLIFQFLIESLVITFSAFVLSLLLLQGSLPLFNTLIKSSISIPYESAGFWAVMVSYVLATGLLAGSRPAFYLSSFQPVKVLKCSVRTGRSATRSRKSLVVLQFSCSIALIISTIIIYQQIQHVKDALIMSPFSSPEPIFYILRHDWGTTLIYRLSSNVSTPQAIAGLTRIFNKYNTTPPYIYHFSDETYAAKFSLEILIGSLSGLFATLAILISCLGLFGLAAFMAEQRTREIGIRKVLGASLPQVWLLLTRDFVVLVGISCLIASPVAGYFLQNWLKNYTYRISIGPGVFIAAAFAALSVTLLTISFQAIRAGLTNPVKSLRSE